MEETMDTKERVTEGFYFYTDKDAQMASLERKKIEYLEERMDYTQPDTILKIYDKAIHDRVFKTPVGILYLKGVQDYLYEQETIPVEEIAPIPLYQTYSKEMRESSNPAKSRVKAAELKKEKNAVAMKISVMINILLAFAVIAMFVIALNADQPNILNYEQNLLNRYATWEQDLTQREQAVREKELEGMK